MLCSAGRKGRRNKRNQRAEADQRMRPAKRNPRFLSRFQPDMAGFHWSVTGCCDPHWGHSWHQPVEKRRQLARNSKADGAVDSVQRLVRIYSYFEILLTPAQWKTIGARMTMAKQKHAIISFDKSIRLASIKSSLCSSCPCGLYVWPLALCSLQLLVSANITDSRVIHMIAGQRKVLASGSVRCRDTAVAKKL
jgi:hypothetical protein